MCVGEETDGVVGDARLVLHLLSSLQSVSVHFVFHLIFSFDDHEERYS